MFGLYMLAIYLGVAVIGAGIVALLVVVALAVGLVTHPIRTLALVFHKLAALAAGLALILALIVWFWYDHSKPDFAPCFWGSIGVIVASILIRALAEWILERPTRAERRAMKRAAAQETGRVTMRMPVSEEVAAAFESTRDGRRASLCHAGRRTERTAAGIMDFATGTRKEGHDGQSRAIAAHTGTARGTARP